MLTIVALMLSLMCVVVDSSTVMDVFRLIQYDLHGGPLGSRRASLNQVCSVSRYIDKFYKLFMNTFNIPRVYAHAIAAAFAHVQNRFGGILSRNCGAIIICFHCHPSEWHVAPYRTTL